MTRHGGHSPSKDGSWEQHQAPPALHWPASIHNEQQRGGTGLVSTVVARRGRPPWMSAGFGFRRPPRRPPRYVCIARRPALSTKILTYNQV